MGKESSANGLGPEFAKKITEELGIRAPPEQVLELITYARQGVAIEVAAVAAGVPLEETKRPSLAGLIAIAQAQYEATLMRVVSVAATRDWHAAAFILERRFPERWGREQAERRAKAESSAQSGARVRVAVPDSSTEQAAVEPGPAVEEVSTDQPPIAVAESTNDATR